MIRVNINTEDNDINLVLLQLFSEGIYKLLYEVVIIGSLTNTNEIINTLIETYNGKINLQDSDDNFQVLEIEDKRVVAYDWVNSLILMHKMSGG